jgi:hypothetical protein
VAVERSHHVAVDVVVDFQLVTFDDRERSLLASSRIHSKLSNAVCTVP